jgi:hypothetical protein
MRSIPIPPALVTLLRAHLKTCGTTGDGRLFRTARGGALQDSACSAVWQAARKAVFTSAQQASPLARPPSDLRHAAVSLWLNAGVPATEVARRAGHSIAVLLKVYAPCIDGQAHTVNHRITGALSGPTSPRARASLHLGVRPDPRDHLRLAGCHSPRNRQQTGWCQWQGLPGYFLLSRRLGLVLLPARHGVVITALFPPGHQAQRDRAGNTIRSTVPTACSGSSRRPFWNSASNVAVPSVCPIAAVMRLTSALSLCERRPSAGRLAGRHAVSAAPSSWAARFGWPSSAWAPAPPRARRSEPWGM